MRKKNTAREFVKGAVMKCMWVFPIKKNKIVFSCFTGKRYGDSPRAIAEEIISEGLDYEMIWLMQKGYEADLPPQIKRKSFSFFSQAYHLATAKIWVDSHTKWHFVAKRKGQYYIETWHGCISKKVEGDASNVLPKDYLERTKHNAELADLFISNSKFTTELYRRAFWYKGEILECGCPKNDVYFRDNQGIKDKVRTSFHIPADCKIALYAPTFRVNRGLDSYTLDYPLALKALEAKFGGNWVLLVRLHPVLIKKADKFIEYTNQIINATYYGNMQELLTASDVYITDYSSPMFEFSISRKPVFLFAADYEDYMKDRGWYFDYFNMPFPAAKSNEELYDLIGSFSQKEYIRRLEAFWREIGLNENGSASKAVVNIIKRVQ